MNSPVPYSIHYRQPDIDATDWDVAPCRNDPEYWFPDKGDGARLPRKLCDTCPFELECLLLGWRDHFGIWGGMSNKDRQRFRRVLEERLVAEGRTEYGVYEVIEFMQDHPAVRDLRGEDIVPGEYWAGEAFRAVS